MRSATALLQAWKHLTTCSIYLAAILCLSGCLALSSTNQGAGHFRTVVVDAGHGGHDRGARAVSGMYEKDLALDVARRLKLILERARLRVVMTRRDDTFIPLGRRTAISNRLPGSIFVSVHFNWSPSRIPAGVETYYFQRRARRLAHHIQRSVLATRSTSNRGTIRRGFYVLRKTRNPAVLVECGFVSNRAENALFQTAAGREQLANAIARGILAERRGTSP